MKFHKSILIGLCIAALGGISVPLTANAGVNVYLEIPPPPLRVEPVPTPRHGYIWVSGYWDASHHRHVWHDGYWVHERRGYYYAPPRWVERNHRWELEQGNWRRGDRDHDGVPNGRDHAPDNPYRR
jgi:hypothetical protein